MRPTISVIIPTLNEEKHLAPTLKQLSKKDNLEIVVVDGGSSDKTVELAKASGAQVLFSSPGRGTQLNHGAKNSSGELLLFLHSDTKLPINFTSLIQEAVKRKYFIAGAFSLRIGSQKRSLAIIAFFANVRSRLLQLPYGDQAIFTRRTSYDLVGGFAEVPIMEDYIFVRKLRKHGSIFTLRQPVTTSARRWQNIGIIRTTSINQLIVIGYICGIKLSTLAHWYQRLKGVGDARK